MSSGERPGGGQLHARTVDVDGVGLDPERKLVAAAEQGGAAHVGAARVLACALTVVEEEPDPVALLLSRTLPDNVT